MAAALRFTYLPVIPSPFPTPSFTIQTYTSTVLAANGVSSMTTVVGLGPRAVSYTTVYVTPTPSATATSAPEKPEPVYGDLTWSYVVLLCVPFVVLAIALYANHRDRRRHVADQDIEMQSFQKFWFPWRELDPGEVPNEIYSRTGSRRNADPEDLAEDDEVASDKDSITAMTGRASPDIGPKSDDTRNGGKTETASPNPWAAHIPSYYGNLPFPVSPVSTASPSQGTSGGAGSSNAGKAQIQPGIQTTAQRRAVRSRNRFAFSSSSSEDEADGQPAEPQHSYYADPSTRAGKRPVKL